MTLPLSIHLPLMRVDQVGSLLRPANLKEMFAKHARSEASDEQLRRHKTRPFARSLPSKRRINSRSSPMASSAVRISWKAFPSS